MVDAEAFRILSHGILQWQQHKCAQILYPDENGLFHRQTRRLFSTAGLKLPNESTSY